MYISVGQKRVQAYMASWVLKICQSSLIEQYNCVQQVVTNKQKKMNLDSSSLSIYKINLKWIKYLKRAKTIKLIEQNIGEKS